MIPRSLTLGAILLASGTLSAQAPPAAQPYQPPYDVDVVDLPAASNGVGYRLFVRKPLRAPPPGERAVAVYVLDALWDLPAVAAMNSNAEFLGHLPPIYYVGVGYQNETEGVRLEANRTRDYTPTAFAPPDPSRHFLKPVDYLGSGGADRYLDVLEREIIPFVEARYPVAPDVRGIVGKSMAGLLATHALLARPRLFSHYLIISPALWWDDYFLDFRDRAVMRQERATHDRKLAKPTRVWIGLGDGEERLGMIADVYVLARSLRLRNDSLLDLTVKLLEGEIHESIYPAAFTRGIRALFPR